MENVTRIFSRNVDFYPKETKNLLLFLIWVLSKIWKVVTFIQFLHFHEILVHEKDELPLVLTGCYLGC